MRISPWKTALLTAALATSLVACQDENQIKGIPERTEATTTPAPVALPPAAGPTTSVAVSATTTAAAEAPTTSVAPTTTVDVHLEAEAMYASFRADHYACQSDPGACDPTQFLVAGSEFEQGYQSRRAGRAAAGRYLVPGPDNRYVINKVLTVGSGLLSVEICSFAHNLWKLVDETPDRADDAIIDETFNSVVIEHIYKQLDGQWRLLDESLLSETLGEDTCTVS